MYTLTVRDHIMIAHSFKGDPFFGPAQNMHGATFIVDATFKSDTLNAHNVVIDIGFGHKALKAVLDDVNYKNLDEEKAFAGQLTTTEFLCHYIHNGLKKKVAGYFDGQIKVTLHESHIAWASYEG